MAKLSNNASLCLVKLAAKRFLVRIVGQNLKRKLCGYCMDVVWMLVSFYKEIAVQLPS